MVKRVFVEKKAELAHEAKKLFSDAVNLLGIKSLTGVRVINRYDVDNITDELFDYACGVVCILLARTGRVYPLGRNGNG